MSRTRSDSGMTLIEVIIASTILSAVIIMTFMILISSTNTVDRDNRTGDLAKRGRIFGDELKKDFLTARFTGTIAYSGATLYAMGTYTNDTEIRYRIPVGRNPNGTNLYGCVSPLPGPNNGPKADWAVFIRFEANTQLRESINAPLAAQPVSSYIAPLPAYPALAVEILNVDINGDGDRTDTFVRGKIKKYVVAPSTDLIIPIHPNPISTETLSDMVILRVHPLSVTAFNGPMLNDTLTSLNPLFRFVNENGATVINTNLSVQGKGVLIDITHGDYDNLKKGFQLVRNSETIKFRNSQ